MKSDCESVRRRLLAFAEGDLGSDDSREVQRHLDSCGECCREVEAWRRDVPRFGDVQMGAEFWEPHEAALLERVAGVRPAWRRWLEALLAPLPVPRVVALAAAVALVLLASGPRPAVSPQSARPETSVAAPRPVLDFDGLSPLSADLG